MERCDKMCGIAGYKFIDKDENSFQENVDQILNSLKIEPRFSGLLA